MKQEFNNIDSVIKTIGLLLLVCAIFLGMFFAFPNTSKPTLANAETIIDERGETQRFYYDGWISVTVSPQGNQFIITLEDYEDGE